jgi:hypothetical protein
MELCAFIKKENYSRLTQISTIKSSSWSENGDVSLNLVSKKISQQKRDCS